MTLRPEAFEDSGGAVFYKVNKNVEGIEATRHEQGNRWINNMEGVISFLEEQVFGRELSVDVTGGGDVIQALDIRSTDGVTDISISWEPVKNGCIPGYHWAIDFDPDRSRRERSQEHYNMEGQLLASLLADSSQGYAHGYPAVIFPKTQVAKEDFISPAIPLAPTAYRHPEDLTRSTNPDMMYEILVKDSAADDEIDVEAVYITDRTVRQDAIEYDIDVDVAHCLDGEPYMIQTHGFTVAVLEEQEDELFQATRDRYRASHNLDRYTNGGEISFHDAESVQESERELSALH